MALTSTEIKETIGVISESAKGWKKELNLISWNGKEAKYDLREWSPEHEKMGKGIISREEYGLFISCEDQNTSLIACKLEEATLLLEQLSSPTVLDTLSYIVEQRTLAELTPSVLNLFVSKIEIGENNNIRIHYKFQHSC